MLGTKATASVTAECARNPVAFVSAVILSIALLFAGSAHSAAAPAAQLDDDVYAGLLGWAIKLSGYSRPAVTPDVRFVSQEFFNDNACHHKECRVWGWYPNTGEHTVYVHKAVQALIADGSSEKSLLAASIIVHEFTHYLQAANRGFAPYRCEEALALEREAYGVQSAYIVAYGRYLPIGLSMHNAGCEGSAAENMHVDSVPAGDSP